MLFTSSFRTDILETKGGSHMTNLVKIVKSDENALLTREFLLYMKSDKGCSPKTVAAYSQDLKEFIAYFQNQNLLELKETDVRNYKFYLVDKGNAPRTVNRKLSVIRSFYSYFVNHDDWDVYKSPARNVQKMKIPKTIPVTMSESEAETLLDGILLLGTYATRDYALFSTFLFTGIRVAELINLNVSDINFDTGMILIRQGKGNRDREIPMIPRLVESLKQFLYAGTAYLAPNKTKNNRSIVNKQKSGREYFLHNSENQSLFLTKYGDRYSEKGIDYLFKQYINKLGIHKEGLSLHALRRSCLTFLYRQGVDLFALKEISGHVKIQTLEHYIAVDYEKVKTVASKHPLANRGINQKLVDLVRNMA